MMKRVNLLKSLTIIYKKDVMLMHTGDATHIEGRF